MIEGIRARHLKHLPLNAASIVRGEFKDIPLHIHALKFFQTWADAVRAAGLEPREVNVHLRNRYDSKATIIAEIGRRLSLGLSVKHGATHKEDSTLVASAYRCFGSWNKAIEAAGLSTETLANPMRPRLLKREKQILAGLPAPGRLLAFVDGSQTPVKSIGNLAGHFYLMCAVIKPAGNYVKMKKLIAGKSGLLPRGALEFEAARIVDPGSSAWQKHSVKKRIDTLKVLYDLLHRYAEAMVFGYISAEPLDARMQARLPAALGGKQTKINLEAAFFSGLMPHLKTLNREVGVVMNSDVETRSGLHIQPVARSPDMYQGGVLRVGASWEIGVQLANLAAYTFNRHLQLRDPGARGRTGLFDDVIMDAMERLGPLFHNVLELDAKQAGESATVQPAPQVVMLP